MKDNLQQSEIMIALILRCLMKKGISGDGLRFSDIGAENELRRFFSPCVEWLKSEGLVRYNSVKEAGQPHPGAIYVGATLTSRGFKALGESIDLSCSSGNSCKIDQAGSKVADVVNEVADGRKNYSQLGDFFGGLLGGFTKSLGS